ncbi:pantetheine-phosphate adenylyltransferase [Lactobacillus xylocopicola]|uniref:Phosphopantetheine adenylyltransferase n=1 Tax=Lactobacillus xylocopicola TaxID=2976676 RepID=A0ABM8BH50_9LACO|nr:pantetheine-phosphate adenylyltransferase [Lactobacillus xylocopicola]BDR60428.1 phosphopantetheine adenylyltransferase [Lactobacillus xylocopicola]
MNTALFPGSFDPITKGHVEVVRQAARIFDKVIVAVMTNTAKSYLFTVEERMQFVQDALRELPKVEVVKRPDELTIQTARDLQATAIVRGVRNDQDFLYEQQIAAMNKELAPEVETVLLFTRPQDSFVASSVIKEVAHFGGEVSSFLPAMAAAAVKEKLGNR